MLQHYRLAGKISFHPQVQVEEMAKQMGGTADSVLMLMGLAKARLESSVCFMLQVGGACLETGDSVSIISKDIGD